MNLTEKTKKKRNGKIELLRFIFCLTVFLYHMNKDLGDKTIVFPGDYTLFLGGRYGVEFFFLTTGYLTAMSIYRRKQAGSVSLGDDTWKFMKGKVSALWKPHILMCIFVLIYRVGIHGNDAFKSIIEGLPGMFFLQMVGFNGTNLISVEWYVSSMLLALILIYPICWRWYEWYSRAAAPLIGVMLIGLLVNQYGSLSEPRVLMGGFMYTGNIRAIAGISLGIFIYELMRVLTEKGTLDRHRLLVTIAELGIYGFVLYYFVMPEMDMTYIGTVTFLLAIAVGLSFTGKAYLSFLFNNPICTFLGKLSLPFYLSQNLARNITKRYFSDLVNVDYIIMCAKITLAFAISLMILGWIWTQISRLLKKNKPEVQ